jgi:hypothetical protein
LSANPPKTIDLAVDLVVVIENAPNENECEEEEDS